MCWKEPNCETQMLQNEIPIRDCSEPKTNGSIEGDVLQWRQITDKSEAAHAF